MQLVMNTYAARQMQGLLRLRRIGIARAFAAQLHACAGLVLDVPEVRALGPEQLASNLVPRVRIEAHLQLRAIASHYEPLRAMVSPCVPL